MYFEVGNLQGKLVKFSLPNIPSACVVVDSHNSVSENSASNHDRRHLVGEVTEKHSTNSTHFTPTAHIVDSTIHLHNPEWSKPGVYYSMG